MTNTYLELIYTLTREVDESVARELRDAPPDNYEALAAASGMRALRDELVDQIIEHQNRDLILTYQSKFARDDTTAPPVYIDLINRLVKTLDDAIATSVNESRDRLIMALGILLREDLAQYQISYQGAQPAPVSAKQMFTDHAATLYFSLPTPSPRYASSETPFRRLTDRFTLELVGNDAHRTPDADADGNPATDSETLMAILHRLLILESEAEALYATIKMDLAVSGHSQVSTDGIEDALAGVLGDLPAFPSFERYCSGVLQALHDAGHPPTVAPKADAELSDAPVPLR